MLQRKRSVKECEEMRKINITKYYILRAYSIRQIFALGSSAVLNFETLLGLVTRSSCDCSDAANNQVGPVVLGLLLLTFDGHIIVATFHKALLRTLTTFEVTCMKGWKRGVDYRVHWLKRAVDLVAGVLKQIP